MRYIIYARKSTQGKSKQVQSIGDQIDVLTRIAKERDLNIVKTFTESKSAKAPYKRDVYTEMIQFIKDGHADALLVWHVDRLFRNSVDGGEIQWLLKEKTIQEMATPERTYRPEDNALLLSVETGMSIEYINAISRNSKRGIRSKLKKGTWPIFAPIGYINKDKKIIVDKKRAKYIRKAFELYATGSMSLKEVSDQLYDDGFRTPKGAKYYKSNIQGMLQRTFYYGVMEMRGEYYVGTHEPIINKELFDQVQDVLHGKKHTKRQKHFFPYRGMFACEKCGCMITASKKRGHDYYYCTNGKGTCNQHKNYMRGKHIEKIVGKSLINLKFEERYVDIMYKASLEKLESDKSYTDNIANSLSKELNLISTKRNRLLEGYCSNIISKDVYTQKEQLYNKEEADIKAKLNNIKNKTLKASSTLEQQRNIFLTACTLQKTFLKAKNEAKQKTLQKVLWNATIEDKEIANLSLKPAYQMLFEVEDLSDFENLRLFNHSSTSP